MRRIIWLICLNMLVLVGCSPPIDKSGSEMGVVHVIMKTGASNAPGIFGGTPPAGIPIAEALMPTWVTINFDDPDPDADAFHDLEVRASGDFGSYLALGRGLYDMRIRAAIGVLARGASDISQWLPGGPYYAAFIAELTEFKAAVGVRFPNDAQVWHWIDQRGETEIRSANPNQAINFGGRLADLREEIAAVIGQVPKLHTVLTHSGTEGANVATNTGPLYAGMIANSDFTISINDLALQEGVHLTSAAQNVLGGRELASLLLEINMGAPTEYARNQMLRKRLGLTADAAPANWYIRLRLNGVELSTNGYAAVAVVNNTTNWPNAAGRVKAKAGSHAVGPATGGTLTFNEVCLYDASTAGNCWWEHTLGASVTLQDGESYVFDATGGSEINITGPVGAWPDAEVHAVQDFYFGATAYTVTASIQFAYFTNNPQGGGPTEVTGTGYARDSFNNNDTEWTAPVGGIARLLNDIGLGTAGSNWTTATHAAMFRADGTTLLQSCALPENRAVLNGQTETIKGSRVRSKAA